MLERSLDAHQAKPAVLNLAPEYITPWGEDLLPHLRTDRKVLLTKFRKLGHGNGKDQVKIYKYDVNVERSVEVGVSASAMAPDYASFCFLGHWPSLVDESRNWHFSMFSAVPTREEGGRFVWRLDSQTLSTIEFDREAHPKGLMTIYFGVFGWKEGSDGTAMV